jgi:hypothetical protein
LKIESRKWIAAWYRCPSCGAQSGNPMLTPYQWKHRHSEECYRCNRHKELIKHRWYTTFAIEPGISQTIIAGTLEKLGPFTICNIVHHNISVFRRWYRRRKAEEAEKTRLYQEYQRKLEAEWSERRRQMQAVVTGGDDFDAFEDEI